MNPSDVNLVSVGRALLEILKIEFPQFECDEEINYNERQIAELLLTKLGKITTNYEIIEEHENSIGQIPGSSRGMDNDSVYTFKDDDDDFEMTEVENQHVHSGYSIKQKAKIIDLIDTLKANGKSWKFETIKSKYPGYTHPKCYKAWKSQIQSGGTEQEILSEIDKFTFTKFKECRDEFKTVHDIDIRRWALQRASEFPNFRLTFQASKFWIYTFKKKHRITSRKVTKVVSKKEILKMEEIVESAERFRSEIQNIQGGYTEENIWNTDQIGFAYEYINQRTLSWKGERFTFASGFSPKNAATHSYTVEYIISAAGAIVGNVFLCLKEQDGRLSENIQNNLFLAPNVTVTCTKSGKLTSSQVKYFFDKTAVPNINGKVLYILDSWTGQTNPSIYTLSGNDNQNEVHLKIIPPNCTAFVQPQDVYFNRQVKYFVKHFYSFANIIDRRITSRNDIVKIHSLTHFTFQAPVFKEMIRYSWIKSGLVNLERRYFINVRDVCFNFKKTKCVNVDCNENAFYKCSWCDKILCFSHTYEDYHPYECDKGPYFRG